MLSLEQIKMLVLSAELGSFSACARRLGKVQSAVSHGINSLELDLGVELFDRSTRSPTLTPEGERLIRSAKALLAQSYELEKIAESITRKEEGSLTLALDDAVLLPSVTGCLSEFADHFPHVQLDLITMASLDVIQTVANGKAQMGIMVSEVEANKEVDFCYVGGIDFIAVCGQTHPLAEQPVATELDLMPHRQIAVRDQAKRESQPLISMTPNAWWCTSHLGVLALVRQGIGWAYLPAVMVAPYLASQELVAIKVAFDHKPWSVPIDLVWKKGSHKGPAQQWLFDALKGGVTS
jgi:DNA-binding transcriptional LysR family regulator